MSSSFLVRQSSYRRQVGSPISISKDSNALSGTRSTGRFRAREQVRERHWQYKKQKEK
jgi:hypothetical protein